MKSCTECVRVDKDCAYCTDEVSSAGWPAFFSRRHLPNLGARLTTPYPGSGQVQ